MLTPKPRTAENAVNRWPGILAGLGIDQKHLTGKHGPCPACAGADRFRFDNKDGRGTWFCSQCGAGDGFGLLRQVFGWSFRDAAAAVDEVVGAAQASAAVLERTDESKVAALRAVWSASRAVVPGDPVALYLARRIGGVEVPPDLRYHPSLRHADGGHHPAMLAMMRYPDGTGASIHRTYLTAGGQKADVSGVKKFMQGKALQTASVRLGRPGRTLGISEGLETALAASKRFGVPVWAATNAVLLECWVPPAGVTEVLIAGDNDSSFTGQAAAFSLARRLMRTGIAVRVEIPEPENSDWLDLHDPLAHIENSEDTKK